MLAPAGLPAQALPLQSDGPARAGGHPPGGAQGHAGSGHGGAHAQGAVVEPAVSSNKLPCTSNPRKVWRLKSTCLEQRLHELIEGPQAG